MPKGKVTQNKEETMDKKEIYELVKGMDKRKNKVEVEFTEPVGVYNHEKKKIHTFSKLIVNENCNIGGTIYYNFYYTSRINARYRYSLDAEISEKIKSVRLVDIKEKNKFKSLEQFAKRFDTRYITKEMIVKLYNEKSSQTGVAYDKRDFKQMGPRGKQAFESFNKQFTGVNKLAAELNGNYEKSSYGDYKTLTVNYASYQNSGRDIRISHSSNQPLVHYSSEFSGCGNGSYGLVVRKGVWLHLEDD